MKKIDNSKYNKIDKVLNVTGFISAGVIVGGLVAAAIDPSLIVNNSAFMAVYGTGVLGSVASIIGKVKNQSARIKNIAKAHRGEFVENSFDPMEKQQGKTQENKQTTQVRNINNLSGSAVPHEAEGQREM